VKQKKTKAHSPVLPPAAAPPAPEMGDSTSSARRRKGAMLAVQIALLAAVTLAAYGPAIQGKFIWDDDKYVENNATLHTIHGLRDIWTRPCSIPQWYPLVHTTFWAEHHLRGLDPLLYHLDNVLLQIVNALLLWLALRRLGLRWAYAAALLFAVHPVMVESVGWITERKNVLSMTFYLGALLAYLAFDPFHRQDAERLPRHWGYYALFAFLYLCALLCKTVTFTLPVAILLLAWWKKGKWTQLLTPLVLAPVAYLMGTWSQTGSFQGIPTNAPFPQLIQGWSATATFPAGAGLWATLLLCQGGALAMLWFIRRRVPWARVAALLPMLALGGAMGLVTAWIEKNYVGADGTAWNMNWAGHAILAARIAWFYLGKLLWPAPIMFFYPRWTIDASQAWQYLYPAAALALVAGLWLVRGRIGRGPLTAVLCFGLGLLPALGFFNVYPMRFSYVADHFQYHASLAIFALVAGVGAALIARAGKLLQRPPDASGGHSGTTDALTRSQGSSPGAPDRKQERFHFLLGAALTGLAAAVLACLTWQQAHDYEDRRALWTNTLARNPQSWISMHNLACIQMDDAFRDPRAHDLDQAVALFQRALIVYAGGDPNCAAAQEDHQARDLILRSGGDANRVYDDVLVNLGIISLKKGNVAQEGGYLRQADDYIRQAHDYFHQALAVRPGVVNMRNRLGKIICEGGRPLDAMPYFQEALAIDPNNPDAHYNIGFVLATMGQKDRAIESIEQAIALAPDQPEPHFTLGQLISTTDPNRALREYRLALDCDSEHARAMDGIAVVLNEEDRPVEALRMARKALAIDANLPASLAIAAGVLACYPDANVRDGRLAMEYATRLCRNTNDTDAQALAVLAGAYAELGQYAQAVQASQKAIDLARARHLWAMADQFSGHQQYYRENRPFRRTPGRDANDPAGALPKKGAALR
jgi:tetratricopeptide (TPR) repeat protein